MLALLGSLAISGALQSHSSLSSFLSQHPWNVAVRGPMVVLDPRSVHAKTEVVNGLADFNRQEMKVGSITAIAPTELVQIDTELKDPPNLFDGLPRRDKVLYLMSLFDADQWNTASSRGIGLSDLRGEQQAVFRSILPSIFSYDNFRLAANAGLVNPPGEPETITLGQEEEAGVRLHLEKRITLRVNLGGLSAFTNQVFPAINDLKSIGSPIYRRRDDSAEDRNSLYGVQIRKVLPNRLKPSDLKYASASLDPPVTVEPGYEQRQPTPVMGYWVWQFGFPMEPAVASRMMDNYLQHERNSPGMIAIDMSAVPINQVGKMLDLWFRG